MNKNLFKWLSQQPCIALVSNHRKQWTIQPTGEINLEFQFEDPPPIVWSASQEEAILHHYEIEEEDLSDLKAEIDASIQKLVDSKYSNKIWWDHREGLDKEQVKQLVEDPEGLWELEDELLQMNWESLWIQRKDKAEEILSDLMGLEHEEHPCYEVLKTYVLEAMSEKIYDDANIRELLGQTSSWGFTVRVDGAETWMQGWQGIRELEEVERICEVLNVSPHQLQGLVAEEELELPAIPERDGNEFISIDDLKNIYVNSIYGGLLCFMITLDLPHWILDGGREEAEEHGITIEKGTRVTIHDYMNGASGGEGFLIKDLVLPPGSFTVGYDLGRKYGIQSCCDYTRRAWEGSIKSNKPPETDDQEQHV